MLSFKEILNNNNQYKKVKNILDNAITQYKENPTKENLNLLTESFNNERQIYKTLWKQYQKQNGEIETITEYDYILIMNDKNKEDVEYTNNMYNRFKNKEFNFSKITNIKDKYIKDFHKFFISEWSFHPVQPIKNITQFYINHVKSFKNFYIDLDNKILLITE